MTFAITTPMVNQFEISQKDCKPYLGYTCTHECKIVLNDGREKTVSIIRSSIRSVLETLQSNQIVYPNQYDFQHFLQEHTLNPHHQKVDAGTILSNIFAPPYSV